MRPRRYCRGDIGRPKKPEDYKITLQGGRGVTAAEILTAAQHEAEQQLLQGGRGVTAAEMRPWCRRKPGLRCFNEAAALLPRRSAILPSSRVGAPPLQGGRGVTAAEISFASQDAPWISSLQGGRGVTAAEMRAITAGIDGTVAVLQGGRGVTAAEIAFAILY